MCVYTFMMAQMNFVYRLGFNDEDISLYKFKYTKIWKKNQNLKHFLPQVFQIRNTQAE
jgi:hypothetical protein